MKYKKILESQNSFSHVAMLADFEYQENNVSIIEVLKAGKVLDRDLTITEKMLSDYVTNFNNGVYGTEIQVNLGHNREGEAAGWIRSLMKVGDRLLAEVEWTPLGIEKIKSKQYRFTSSELSSVRHHKTGKIIPNVLIGVGLTNIPAVKGLAAVSLSEEVKQFINNQKNMDKNELLNEEEETKTSEEVTKESTEEVEETTQGQEDSTDTDVEDESTEEGEELAEKKTEKMAKKKKKIEEYEEDEDEEEEKDLKSLMKKKEKLEKKIKAMEAKEKKMSKKENLSEKTEIVSLSEYQALQEKTAKLEEQLKTKELSETIDQEFILSEGSNKGYFAKNEKDEVLNFIKALSSDQQEQFKALLGKVRTVDLSIKGVSKTSKVKLSGDTEEDIVALSESLLESGKAKDIFEAQKMAKEQLNQ